MERRAGQELVALQLALGQLKRSSNRDESGRALADCDEALKRINKEIRNLSFMNHPPEIKDRGLARAIESLARGFGVRAEIDIDVNVMLDPSTKVAASKSIVLYRVAQEALTNVHRHANANKVMLWLIPTGRFLHLIVEDDGIGSIGGHGKFSEAPGVGVAGMKDRLREIGGRLSIKRLEKGTVLRASVPFSRRNGGKSKPSNSELG